MSGTVLFHEAFCRKIGRTKTATCVSKDAHLTETETNEHVCVSASVKNMHTLNLSLVSDSRGFTNFYQNEIICNNSSTISLFLSFLD